MKKKRIAQYCCAALVASGIGLNIQNALADYGIGVNSLSLVAVGGSNSGSNSNSNSNSNWDSNTNTGPWDESDSDGSGLEKTKYEKETGTEVYCGFSGEPGEIVTFNFNGTQYSCEIGANGSGGKDVPYNWVRCWENGTVEVCVKDEGPNPTVISRSK